MFINVVFINVLTHNVASILKYIPISHSILPRQLGWSVEVCLYSMFSELNSFVQNISLSVKVPLFSYWWCSFDRCGNVCTLVIKLCHEKLNAGDHYQANHSFYCFVSIPRVLYLLSRFTSIFLKSLNYFHWRQLPASSVDTGLWQYRDVYNAVRWKTQFDVCSHNCKWVSFTCGLGESVVNTFDERHSYGMWYWLDHLTE